jgi:hypothetical protein
MRNLKSAALAALILAGTTAGALAQATTTPTTEAPMAGAASDRVTDTDDDGFDLGWLGLIGLLGLAGLRRPKHVAHVDTTATRRV